MRLLTVGDSVDVFCVPSSVPRFSKPVGTSTRLVRRSIAVPPHVAGWIQNCTDPIRVAGSSVRSLPQNRRVARLAVAPQALSQDRTGLSFGDQAVRIVLQQESTAHEPHGCGAHLFDVGIMRPITLFER